MKSKAKPMNTRLHDMPSDDFWSLYGNHDCHLSGEDGCEICDEAAARESDAGDVIQSSNNNAEETISTVVRRKAQGGT